MGRTKRIRKQKGMFKERDKNVSASDTTVELLRWMKTSELWKPTCTLQLTEFAPFGLRGLMVKHDLDVSEVLVEIPFKLLVTKSVAVSFIKESSLFQNQLELMKNLTTLELLVIFLLLNKKQEEFNIPVSQFWKPYMNTLPHSYEVPYFCNDDEVNLQ
jgi:hypothetical protein